MSIAPHPSHLKEINKLNRAIGQLEGIKKMIEGNRYCPDILEQLKATKSAINNVEQSILKTHVQHCLLSAVKDKNESDILAKVAELQNIIKNYV